MLKKGMYVYYNGGKYQDFPCASVRYLKENYPYRIKEIIEFPRGKQVVLENVIYEGEYLKFEIKWFSAYRIRNAWCSKENLEKQEKGMIRVTWIRKEKDGFFKELNEVNYSHIIELTENSIQIFTKHTGYMYNCIVY